jgi:hypothetical protein
MSTRQSSTQALAIPAIDIHSARRNALLCALLVGAAIVATWPVATVPAGDDFSYARTALDFARTGRLHYNGWAAPIQGWWAAWGALFIKLFGFSFTILRFAVIPVAMASAYLFHQVLVRFGIGARDALIGALAIGLSPLYIFLAATFLTDIPGLFVIVLCLYMCQRAVLASTDRAALGWLAFAALANLLLGTVRQTSWMGTLVMVPSTAWFLRRRQGMIPVAAAMFLISLGGIFLCMHWAARQPYFTPEPFFIQVPLRGVYWYALGQWGKAVLFLLLLLAPILVGWLPAARRLDRVAVIRVAILLCAATVALLLRAHSGQLYKWIMPWLIPVFQTQGMVGPDQLLGGFTVLPTKARFFLSLLILALGFVLAEIAIARRKTHEPLRMNESPSWSAALWLLVPFAVGYLLTLVPRSATTALQDRYLLGVMPTAIVLLLLLYQRWFASALPSVSVAVLVLFGLYTVAATHDLYSDLRAGEVAVQQLRADGVPRTAIVEGFGSDGWVQLENAGYFNNENMVLPAHFQRPIAVPWPIPQDCVNYFPQHGEPVIHPKYFIAETVNSCLAPTQYPPIPYRAWLPPFHRTRLIRQLLPGATTP